MPFSVFSFQFSVFRLQASGFRLQASGFRLQASGFSFQFSVFRIVKFLLFLFVGFFESIDLWFTIFNAPENIPPRATIL
jgi:hypothetical protein